MAQEEFVATGRRKTAVAQVRMTSGSGKIEVNGKTFEEYFPTTNLQNAVLHPLQVAKGATSYDISVNAKGGGIAGQAGAARLAIARALIETDETLRGSLKEEGLPRSEE